MSDTSLRRHIIDELDFEPSIDAASIGVAVSEGIVTLTGHVTTYMQKVAAEEAVRRVRGVKGVAEEIEVRPPGTNRVADDEIARRAVSKIEWLGVVPKASLQAIVRNGRLTLMGEVSWEYQKAAVIEAVKSLHGLRGISSQIVVSPVSSAICAAPPVGLAEDTAQS